MAHFFTEMKELKSDVESYDTFKVDESKVIYRKTLKHLNETSLKSGLRKHPDLIEGTDSSITGLVNDPLHVDTRFGLR